MQILKPVSKPVDGKGRQFLSQMQIDAENAKNTNSFIGSRFSSAAFWIVSRTAAYSLFTANRNISLSPCNVFVIPLRIKLFAQFIFFPDTDGR